MSTCPAVSFEDCIGNRAVEANPDIAGIGVIISFLTTTCLAILSALAILVLDRYSKIVNVWRKYVTKNPDLYSEETYYGRGYKLEKHLFWADVARKVLNALNDTQLFTGTAIQLVALIQHCSISIYHYRVVTELANLSVIVHLLSLVTLRDDFVKNRLSSSPRVVAMLFNLGMLGYTTWFGYAYELDSSHEKSSALLSCYYSGHKPDYGVAFYFKWSILLIAAICGHIPIFISMYVTQHATSKRSRLQLWGAIIRNYIITPIYIAYGLVNASIVLSKTQALGTPEIEIDGDEKTWDFGQLLAMLLLGFVLLPGWEGFHEETDIEEIMAI